MVGALATLLGNEVIGQIGGQAFAPVAAGKVDEYTVAPPVVQEFMRVGRMQDEWKPDDLLAQEREGRHAVAGLPEVLHQRELGIRIRAEKAAVHLKVLRGRIEIAV